MITVRAHAKLNLTLEVLRKRDDHYHEIVSVMQAISLHDTLGVKPADKLSLDCSDSSLENEGNLVLQAARALQEKTGVTAGAHLSLRKEIPIAAGLGGGSADAAAALWALNKLWETNLPPDELLLIGSKVGSDVPFCLAGGTALMEGRGERFTPLPPIQEQWLVIIRPPMKLDRKTPTLYSMLTPNDWSDGMATKQMLDALYTGEPTRDLLHNTFDRIADKAYTGITDWRARLWELTGGPVHLAGAGPALYALVASEEAGQRIVQQLDKDEAWVVSTVPHGVKEVDQ